MALRVCLAGVGRNLTRSRPSAYFSTMSMSRVLYRPASAMSPRIELVQPQNRRLGHRQSGTPGVDELKGIPVAADLLFVSVSRPGTAEHQGPHPLLVHLDPLDTIARHRAFDQGMLSQDLEPLRRLPGVQLLPPDGLAEIRQVPARGGGDRGKRADEALQSVHGWPPAVVGVPVPMVTVYRRAWSALSTFILARVRCSTFCLAMNDHVSISEYLTPNVCRHRWMRLLEPTLSDLGELQSVGPGLASPDTAPSLAFPNSNAAI